MEILAFGVFLLCFRNWWVAGVFGPSDTNHPNYTEHDLTHFYQRTKIILTGVDHGNPSFTTFVFLLGTLLALLALVWRPKFLQNYPMAIGLALIGLFLPYWFVANWGYAPRLQHASVYAGHNFFDACGGCFFLNIFKE